MSIGKYSPSKLATIIRQQSERQALKMHGDRDFPGIAQRTTQTITATSDGTGTGQILDGVGFASVAAVDDDANDIVTLPTIVAGKEVCIMCAVACELRTKLGEASKSINGTGVSNGSGVQIKELALSASTLYRCVAVSSTAWFVTKIPATGAPAGGGTPD